MVLLLSVVTAAGAAAYKVNIGTMTPTAGGNIVVASSTAETNSNVVMTVIPANGYYIEASDISIVPSGDEAQGRTRAPIISPTVTPVKDQITPEGYGQFQFTMPASNVTVNAEFHVRTDISAAWTGSTPSGTVKLSLTTVAYDAEEHKATLVTEGADGGVIYNTNKLYGNDTDAGTGQATRSSTNGLREYDATPVYSSADYISAGTKTVEFTLRGQYKGTAKKTYTINKQAIYVKAKDQTIAFGGGITSTIAWLELATGSLLTGHTITGGSVRNTAVEGTTSGTSGGNPVTYPASGVYTGVLEVTPNSVVIKDGDNKDVSANYEVTTTEAAQKGNLTINKYDMTNAAIKVTENVWSYDGETHTATVRVYQTFTAPDLYEGFISPDEYDVIYFTDSHTFTGTQTGTDSETGLPIYDLPKNIGEYQIKVKAKDGAGVTGEKVATDVLTISNQMKITADAGIQSRFYTESNPVMTATFSGYPASDAGAVTSQGELTTTAATTSPVGSYPIRFSSLPTVGDNYMLVNGEGNALTTSVQVGTLNVLPLALEMTTATIGNNVDRAYTGTAIVPDVTVKGYNDITIPASNNQLVYVNSSDQELEEAVSVGTYTVIARAKAASTDVAGEKEVGTLTITPKVVTTASAEITIVAGSPVYDGTAKEPTSLVVKDGTQTIAATNYTASYSNNVNAGSNARVTLVMKGNYEGTVVRTYTIQQRPVTVKAKDQTILVGEVIRTGDGMATATGLVSGHTLKGASVSTTYTAAGNYPTGITPSGAWIVAGETDMTPNYAVTYQTGSLTIAAPNTNPNITVDDIADQTYDGTTKTPAVTVKNSGTALTAGTDYDVSYENNVEAGTNTARALIVLKGTYSGYMVKNFTITPKALTVTANALTAVTYGKVISTTPTNDVTVTGLIGGHVLSSVRLTPASTDVGTDIVVTPSLAAVRNGSDDDVTGNYTITYNNGTVTINQKPYAGNEADFTVENVSDVVYNGQEHRPEPVIKDSQNSISEVLEEGKDYTVSYTGNINAGTATVAVSLQGNYSGNFNKTFTIAQRGIVVQAKDQTIVTGDAPFETLNFVGMIGQVPGHVLGSITLGYGSTKETTFTTLAAGSYDLHVKTAVINDGSDNDVSANYTWEEAVGTLTVLEKNTTATMALTGGGTYEYTGAPIMPEVTVTGGGSYTLIYQGNIEVGTGRVIAQFSDNTALSKDFNITKRAVTVTASAQTINYGGSISSDASQVTATNLIDGHRIASVMLTNTAASNDPGTYSNAITASNAFILDAGNNEATSNYTITYVTGDLTISGKPYSATTFTVDLDEGNSYPYKAAPYTPAVTVKNGTKTLICGTDYDVAYSNNENAGTATVTVTFKGNYSGSATTTFTITKRRLTITPKEQTVSYGSGGPKSTAADLTTLVTADGLLEGHTLKGVTLKSDKSSVGVYPSGIYATAAVVMSGTTNVSANYEVVTGYGKLTITPSGNSDITVEGLEPYYDYTGLEVKPKVTVKIGNTVLTEGSDYDITYENNIDWGTDAKLTVKLKNNYTGEMTVTFEIRVTKVHVYQTELKKGAEGQYKKLVSLGLLVTDIENKNRMFTFSNALNTLLPENVRQYTCRVIDNTVHLFEVKSDVIPANTGVLLIGDVGTHEFVATDREADMSLYKGNELVPVVVDTHISQVQYAYLLTNNEFAKMNLNFSIPDGKAYLQWPDGTTYNAAPARLTINGGTTGIADKLSDTESDDVWYDLSGRRITDFEKLRSQHMLPKGTYVKKGMKVVIK